MTQTWAAADEPTDVLSFITHTKLDYEVNWHHRVLCQYVDKWVKGEITRLMIFCPPQTGKSEVVSRRLPAYILGRDPDAPIIACSYGDDLAQSMNRDVQRIIDSPEYAELFPGTKLFSRNVRTLAQGMNYLRNSDLFEIVGRRGRYRSAGVGGGIVGRGFLYGIIDDPIKSAAEAYSKTYRDSLWRWYTQDFYSRQGKNARILIMHQRWHEDDLAGRLLKQMQDDPKADQWTVISFPAILEGEPGPDDPRQSGEALWPDRYPVEMLNKVKAQDPRAWEAMYMQRPRPAEGSLFKSEWLSQIARFVD